MCRYTINNITSGSSSGHIALNYDGRSVHRCANRIAAFDDKHLVLVNTRTHICTSFSVRVRLYNLETHNPTRAHTAHVAVAVASLTLLLARNSLQSSSSLPTRSRACVSARQTHTHTPHMGESRVERTKHPGKRRTDINDDDVTI